MGTNWPWSSTWKSFLWDNGGLMRISKVRFIDPLVIQNLIVMIFQWVPDCWKCGQTLQNCQTRLQRKMLSSTSSNNQTLFHKIKTLSFRWERVMDGEDLYLDIGEGVPKMQLVGYQLNASWNIVTFVKIQLKSPQKRMHVRLLLWQFGERRWWRNLAMDWGCQGLPPGKRQRIRIVEIPTKNPIQHETCYDNWFPNSTKTIITRL